MPIPTRARTSALGGYINGHGNEPLRRAKIAPVQSLRIRAVLSAKACNWLAVFVARKPARVSRYTCYVGQVGSAAGSTNALPRIGAAKQYPPTISVPLSSGEERITAPQPSTLATNVMTRMRASVSMASDVASQGGGRCGRLGRDWHRRAR
jgi:hypothetical protein